MAIGLIHPTQWDREPAYTIDIGKTPFQAYLSILRGEFEFAS
jgi:hypothetical protein